MENYTIIVNGKTQINKAVSAETAVRGVMFWYGCGTLFTVLDEKHNASVFRKISTYDPISGHSELLKISS